MPEELAKPGPEALELEEAEAVLNQLAEAFFPDPALSSAPSSGVYSSAPAPLADPASRYRMLLEQMPAVVFIGYMDKGLGEAYVSPHIEAMLGFTHREWLEEPVRWYRQIHPEDKLRWSVDAARFFLTGEPLHAVYRVMSEDGRVVWFQCQASMIRGEDGRPLLVHGVGFDVTELKETERMVSEALAAAQAASRAKSDFLANMSHEIRTPINGIMGMTSLALETSLTREQREYLEVVQQSADALLALVNDILDVSKIEARKLSIGIAPFNPRASIEETARLLGPLAWKKGLELFCQVLPDIPETALGDAPRFRQILVNLIGNAVKFTEHGEVTIRAHVEERTRNGLMLHCRIFDTGPGVPREKQKLIFDRFSQADASSRRRHGGAGLGLTICASLAEMMGGRVWVESEPGKGSTFHVTLRLEAAETGITIAPDPGLGGLHVLVVDASATGREILAGMLEDLGCRATCVASQTEAMELAKSVSLILASGAMQEIGKISVLKPGLTGPEAVGSLAKPVWRADLIEALLRLGGAATQERAPAAAISADRAAPASGSLYILLAEDNPVNQKVAARILERRGHRVRVANNGREAVECATSERFDLILMDLQMPEMDGLEAAQTIRKFEAPSRRYTPVIALTAHAMEGDREKCLEAGMAGHVSKPIIPATLFEAIAKVCSGKL